MSERSFNPNVEDIKDTVMASVDFHKYASGHIVQAFKELTNELLEEPEPEPELAILAIIEAISPPSTRLELVRRLYGKFKAMTSTEGLV